MYLYLSTVLICNMPVKNHEFLNYVVVHTPLSQQSSPMHTISHLIKTLKVTDTEIAFSQIHVCVATQIKLSILKLWKH